MKRHTLAVKIRVTSKICEFQYNEIGSVAYPNITRGNSVNECQRVKS